MSHRSSASRLVVLLTLVIASLASAEGPTFVVRGVEGKEVTGSLVKLADGSLTAGNTTLAATEWLGLSQVGSTLPEFPTGEHLVLGNGDRIPFRDLRLEDEKVYFRHKDLSNDKEVSLPLSALALLWRLAPDGTASPETLRRRLLLANRPRDVVLLRNGDTLEGTLQAIKGGQIDLEVNKKALPARWPQVAAVATSSELLDRQRPKGSHVRVVLAEGDRSPGGRLTLVEVSSDGKSLRGKTAFGAELSVPLSRVVALDRGGGDVVELCDLEPTKYDYSPYLDEKWPWSRDGTVTGHDLRLGGSTFARGIGMHASSKSIYALNGGYRRFDARVGLDDRAGKKGRVRLRVLVDGKAVELTKKDAWAHADGVLRVSVDLTGAKELTLEVQSGPDGPVQAVVNWVEPRLVK